LVATGFGIIDCVLAIFINKRLSEFNLISRNPIIRNLVMPFLRISPEVMKYTRGISYITTEKFIPSPELALQIIY
jgi:uncharacterized protein YqhQ